MTYSSSLCGYQFEQSRVPPSGISRTVCPQELVLPLLLPLLVLQVLTWLVLPFFQVYADAGDFTVGGKCMTSLKENGLLYGLAGAAGGTLG